MCRSTDTLSPSLVRQRRSLKRSDSNGSNSSISSADDATTSSTGSSNSTTTSSQTARKSVSFDDTVKIYHSERLSEDELREVFYRPADYRRFRSDSCLEVLDQQQVQLSPIAALCQALFGIGTVKAKTRCQLGSASGSTTTSSKGHYGAGRRDGLGTSTGKRHDACDYPWMDNYYPQDTGTTVAIDVAERSCLPKLSPSEEPSSPLKSDGSREKEAIRELAFWIP